MRDDETDIFVPSVHEKYANRPDCMENICLADFVSQFNIGSQTRKRDDDDSQEVEPGIPVKKKY